MAGRLTEDAMRTEDLENKFILISIAESWRRLANHIAKEIAEGL